MSCFDVTNKLTMDFTCLKTKNKKEKEEYDRNSVWPTKPSVFTTWPFTKKGYWLCLEHRLRKSRTCIRDDVIAWSETRFLRQVALVQIPPQLTTFHSLWQIDITSVHQYSRLYKMQMMKVPHSESCCRFNYLTHVKPQTSTWHKA